MIDAKGELLELKAESLFDPIEIAILDSSYNNTVLDSLKYGSIFLELAPHLIEMTSNWFGTEAEISLTVTADTLYIVIFSPIHISLGIELDYEIRYKLTSDLTLNQVSAGDKSIIMPYSETGTITENADINWDDGEWVIYSAGELASGYNRIRKNKFLLLISYLFI